MDQDGGKVVSLMHWLLFTPNTLLEAVEKGKSMHRYRSYYGKLRKE